MTAVPTAFPIRTDRFVLLHVLAVPVGIALLAVASHLSGLDDWLAAAFFDEGLGLFPARQWQLLEAVGHRAAKSAMLGLWLLLFLGAVASRFNTRLQPFCSLAWSTVAAMAAGPIIVVILKDLNAYRCPWDLARFGGVGEVASGWFVSRLNAGRCFPSGHAAGGFCLIALYFAGMVGGHAAVRRAGFAAALAAGAVFSYVRMIQGAHFLSHNLWSAAIDWCAAALVFAPSVAQINRRNAEDNRGAQGMAWNDDHPGVKPGAATGLRRIILAGGYSMQGLRSVWRREAAFRQEAVIAMLFTPVALLLPVSAFEKTALIGSFLFVLAVELLNSGLEALVDLVSPEHHPLAGIAKDAGSAAVLMALLLSGGVWTVVLVRLA